MVLADSDFAIIQGDKRWHVYKNDAGEHCLVPGDWTDEIKQQADALLGWIIHEYPEAKPDPNETRAVINWPVNVFSTHMSITVTNGTFQSNHMIVIAGPFTFDYQEPA